MQIDPAQPVTMAGEEIGDLSCYLSDPSDLSEVRAFCRRLESHFVFLWTQQGSLRTCIYDARRESTARLHNLQHACVVVLCISRGGMYPLL